MTRNCDFCQKEYEYKHPTSRFCCTNCRVRFSYKKRSLPQESWILEIKQFCDEHKIKPAELIENWKLLHAVRDYNPKAPKVDKSAASEPFWDRRRSKLGF